MAMLTSLTVNDPSATIEQTFEAKMLPQQTLSRSESWKSVAPLCGVYAITYEDYAYIGLTQDPFSKRWKAHLRALFRNSGKKNHKLFKQLIKAKSLKEEDLTFHVLASFPVPHSMSADLDAVLAKLELEFYSKVLVEGFTPNNEVPRGVGRVFGDNFEKLFTDETTAERPDAEILLAEAVLAFKAGKSRGDARRACVRRFWRDAKEYYNTLWFRYDDEDDDAESEYDGEFDDDFCFSEVTADLVLEFMVNDYLPTVKKSMESDTRQALLAFSLCYDQCYGRGWDDESLFWLLAEHYFKSMTPAEKLKFRDEWLPIALSVIELDNEYVNPEWSELAQKVVGGPHIFAPMLKGFQDPSRAKGLVTLFD